MTLDPLLAEIQAAALTLRPRESNLEAIRRIARAFQAIHNVASIVGFEDLATFTGYVDDLLGQMRDGIVPVTEPLPGLLVAAADQVRLLLSAAQGGPPVDVSLQAALLETAFQIAEPSLPMMKARELEEEASVQDAIVLPV
jgi:two-component system chemotaxis sensor kinase CheA